MTDREKKNQIADILLDFYDEYDSNVINRPMIPNIYAGKILDSLQKEPIIDDLEEVAMQYRTDEFPSLRNGCKHIPVDAFKAGTQWQKQQDKQPINDDLEEAAKNHAVERYRTTRDRELAEKCKWSFKAGAQWQKKQDQSTIELAEDHAMFAGMEKMKEQMMTKSIEAVVSQVPCSNEIILYNPSSVDKYNLPQEMNKLGLNKGDKVKLIIIKQEKK